MNGLKCRLPTAPEIVPWFKVTSGPSAGSVLPASVSPWTEGWEHWTVGLRLGPCCRDSHLWVWDAAHGIKSTKSELTWRDAQSCLEWPSPSCLKDSPLSQAFTDLPLLPIPSPHWFPSMCCGQTPPALRPYKAISFPLAFRDMGPNSLLV